MGLKESGLRGSLRNISTGVSAIPDSGLAHHYDATVLSLNDGDAVSTWTDQEGTNDLTAGTAPVYQTGILNDNPVVRFDASNSEYLDVDWTDISEPYQIFAVMVPKTPVNGSAWWDGLTANSARWMATTADPANWQIFQGDSGISGGEISEQAYVVSTLYRSGTSADTARIDQSGVLSGDSGNAALDGLTLGGVGDLSGFESFDVGELLVYDTELSTADRDEVEQYLTDKWLGSGAGTDPSTTYDTLTMSATDPKSLAITGDGNHAVAVGKGLSVVDISSPESVSEVGTLADTVIDNGYGIAIDGDYAYVAEYLTKELKAVDISDPTNPTVADTIGVSSQARKVWIEGNHALVTHDGQDSADDFRFTTVDVSDPTTLSIADTITGDSDFEYCFEVGVINNTAIVTARGAAQLTFVDVSDPTAVSKSGTFTDTELNYPYGIVIDQNASVAYITLAGDGGASEDDRIMSLDLSTPTNPTKLGTFSSSETIHNYGIDLYNGGETVAVSARDSNNVTTIDVSDPTSMSQVGSVDTGSATFGPYDSAVSGDYTFSCTRSNDELIVSGTQ